MCVTAHKILLKYFLRRETIRDSQNNIGATQHNPHNAGNNDTTNGETTPQPETTKNQKTRRTVKRKRRLKTM